MKLSEYFFQNMFSIPELLWAFSQYEIIRKLHCNMHKKSGPKVEGELLQAFSQYKLLRKSHCNMHTLCSEFAQKKWSESRGGTFMGFFTV